MFMVLVCLLLCTQPTLGELTPIHLPASTSQQCGENVPDISEVLKTVEEMMLNNSSPSSHPKSCLEVKESSPKSPSGYYTLSDGNGSISVSYCNMDVLYSIPFTKQLFDGLQSKYDEIITATEKLDSNQKVIQQTIASISSDVLNLTHKQDEAFETTHNSLSTASNNISAISNNINDVLDLLIENLSKSCNNASETLEAVKKTIGSLSSIINDVLNLTQKHDIALENTDSDISIISNGVNEVVDLVTKLVNLVPISCNDIQVLAPESNSGIYTLYYLNGTAYHTQCNFDELCNTTGPWTRVAFLNMSDPTHECPSGFTLFTESGVRACGKHHTDGGGCISVIFPTTITPYSQVCGRVNGYQYGWTDGFRHTQYSDIDQPYIDGISITHGSPRQHIWTFAAEYREISNFCPCGAGSTYVNTQPSFVGNDYFCEAGLLTGDPTYTLYISDPLWDGQDCSSSESPCCQVPGIPWFHKVLDKTTTDFMELRVCTAFDPGVENSPVGLYEIYIK